jgi:hypothetical protein
VADPAKLRFVFQRISILRGGSKREPSCTNAAVSGLRELPVEKIKMAGLNRQD